MTTIKRALIEHWELLAVAAVAIALRLPYLETRSLWFDEASSWRTASFAFAEMMDSLRLNVHLPLYYLVLKVWMGVFGESVVAMRGLSVACGTLTVVLMGLFGRELYGLSAISEVAENSTDDGERGARAFGLAIATLVAASPYQVLASIEARMYAVGTGVTALASWLLVKALRNRSSNWVWAAYGLACVALLYTHHYALFTVAAQFSFLVLWVVSLFGAGARDEARLLGTRVAIVGAFVALAYLPALQFLLVQTDRVREDYWIAPLGWQVIPETFAQFVVPIEAPGAATSWGWAVFGALGVACAVIVPRARPGDALVLICALGPMIAAGAVSTTVPVWVPRYFRFAHLFVLTSIALAVWRCSRASRSLRIGLFAAIVAGFLAGNVALWQALDVVNGVGLRGAVARILGDRHDDEAIVVFDLFQYLPVKYYAGASAEVRLVRPGITPFWGPHVIRPGDLIEPEAVAGEFSRGVWVVGALPVPINVSALDGLTADRSFQVTSYHELHKRVYVNHYVLRPDGPAPPGTRE